MRGFGARPTKMAGAPDEVAGLPSGSDVRNDTGTLRLHKKPAFENLLDVLGAGDPSLRLCQTVYGFTARL